VRDAIRTDEIPNFNTTIFWEDALRRAVCARLLGERIGFDAEECFTAGLLQDFGLLVMIYLMQEKASSWQELRRQDPEKRLRLEDEVFGTTHDCVVGMLADQWSLPDELREVLGNHHRCEEVTLDNSNARFCQIINGADWMAAVYTADEKGPTLESCRKLLSGHFQFSAQELEELLSAVPERLEDAATALGLRVEQQEDFEQILGQANVRLAQENMSYQELTWHLEKTLKERDQLATELNSELVLAREIQKSLLPREFGTDLPVTGVNISARQLSGDFYDYFKLPDGRIYFSLGDVSGKGITAALLMAKTSSLFHCLGKWVHDPGKLLGQINREICEKSSRGMFVTMAAGIYDPASKMVKLVNAGHMPALVQGREGKIKALSAQSPPLGILPDSEFPVQEISLEGCCMYLFSDGVTEGYIAEGQMLGMRGFLGKIAELIDRPAGEALADIVALFQGSAEPIRDDMTIVRIDDVGMSA
jgi:serine phosphatase RsbU (regulator of sigma subunit)